jgi:hypothetical protein
MAQPADLRMVGFFMIPSFRDVDRAFTLARNSPFDNLLRASGVDLEEPLAEVANLIEGAPERLLEDAAVSARTRRRTRSTGSPLTRTRNDVVLAPLPPAEKSSQRFRNDQTSRGLLAYSRHGLGTSARTLAVFRIENRGTSAQPRNLRSACTRTFSDCLERAGECQADRPPSFLHDPLTGRCDPICNCSIFVVQAGVPSPIPLGHRRHRAEQPT